MPKLYCAHFFFVLKLLQKALDVLPFHSAYNSASVKSPSVSTLLYWFFLLFLKDNSKEKTTYLLYCLYTKLRLLLAHINMALGKYTIEQLISRR